MLALEMEVRLVRWRDDRSEGMVRADVMVMEVLIMVMMRRRVMKGRSMFFFGSWLGCWGVNPLGGVAQEEITLLETGLCGRRVRKLGFIAHLHPHLHSWFQSD